MSFFKGPSEPEVAQMQAQEARLRAHAAEKELRESKVANTVVGERIGKLTNIGTFWLDFDLIAWINMTPADGCKAEIFLTTGKSLHLNQIDLGLLNKYFDQERAKLAAGRDEVRQLEELVK